MVIVIDAGIDPGAMVIESKDALLTRGAMVTPVRLHYSTDHAVVNHSVLRSRGSFQSISLKRGADFQQLSIINEILPES